MCSIWSKVMMPLHMGSSSVMQMVHQAHGAKERTGVICFLKHRLQWGGCLRRRHIMFPHSWHPGSVITRGGRELMINWIVLVFFLCDRGSLAGAAAFSQRVLGGAQEHTRLIQSITGIPHGTDSHTCLVINSPASWLEKHTLNTTERSILWFDLFLHLPPISLASLQS